MVNAFVKAFKKLGKAIEKKVIKPAGKAFKTVGISIGNGFKTSFNEDFFLDANPLADIFGWGDKNKTSILTELLGLGGVAREGGVVGLGKAAVKGDGMAFGRAGAGVIGLDSMLPGGQRGQAQGAGAVEEETIIEKTVYLPGEDEVVGLFAEAGPTTYKAVTPSITTMTTASTGASDSAGTAASSAAAASDSKPVQGQGRAELIVGTGSSAASFLSCMMLLLIFLARAGPKQ